MSGAVPIVILVAVTLFVGVRLRRRSRPMQTLRRTRSAMFAPRLGVIGLVAGREVHARIRGRIFRVGTVLILAGVAAGIIIPTLSRSKHTTEQVAVVGALSAPLKAATLASAISVGATVQLVSEANAAAADADLRSGRVDFAILDARKLEVNKAIDQNDSSTTAQLVQAISTTLGTAEAFESAGLTAAQASKIEHARPLPVTSLQPGSATAVKRPTSVVGVVLLFLMLTQYTTWTLIGVMEEKSSRVAEVLLAAVRPVQLLTGKVLGIGVMVFAQATLIVAFTLGLSKAVGSNLLRGTATLQIISTLVWLVLGYAFYCWVYAAAGSMTSRQDQVQSLALPLSLPIIFGYIMALTTASSGTPSTLFDVLAYLPPTAPFAMPVLVGFGQVTWWEFTGSAAISVLCTIGVAMLAASIYGRAILRIGRRVRLRELMSGAAR